MNKAMLNRLSISENNSIDILTENDQKIYSIGISTGGTAENANIYSRYFHSEASIKNYITLPEFSVKHVRSYQEQLCIDFQRLIPSKQIDILIEVLAIK
jgi:hypothetical protein